MGTPPLRPLAPPGTLREPRGLPWCGWFLSTPDNRQMRRGGSPGTVTLCIGWEPPPFERDANYNAPHARLSPTKYRLCCGSLKVRRVGEITLFLALVHVGGDGLLYARARGVFAQELAEAGGPPIINSSQCHGGPRSSASSVSGHFWAPCGQQGLSPWRRACGHRTTAAVSKGQDPAQQSPKRHSPPGGHIESPASWRWFPPYYLQVITVSSSGHCTRVWGGSGTSLRRLFQPSWRQVRLHSTNVRLMVSCLLSGPLGRAIFAVISGFRRLSIQGVWFKALIVLLQVDPNVSQELEHGPSQSIVKIRSCSFSPGGGGPAPTCRPLPCPAGSWEL